MVSDRFQRRVKKGETSLKKPVLGGTALKSRVLILAKKKIKVD